MLLQTHLQNTLSIFNFTHLIPLSIWIAAILVPAIISGSAIFIYDYFYQHKTQHWLSIWLNYLLATTKRPLLVLSMCYCISVVISILIPNHELPKSLEHYSAAYLLNIVEFITFFWLVFNALVVGKKKLLTWSYVVDNKFLNVLIPSIINSLQVVVFLLMLNLFIPLLNLSGLYAMYAYKMSKVLFIGALGLLFIQIINVFEKIIVHQYVVNDKTTNFTARKIQTQVLLLKRVVLAIAMVITIASIFMVFDSVKNIGAGILTTAGVISAVGAFASQQSLGRIFAGLQIAFTQPIRMGDTIVIENQMGQVEEITLSYIVVKLWDLRRLLLPTDHITSKGLQNLTRDTTQLLGTVFLYTDYTLPVDIIREKFFELLKTSTFWDGKVSNLQVTDIKESTMEIRALVSAEDSGTLWNLRCEIREKLIRFIVQHYPQCLTRLRNITANDNFQSETSPSL